MKIIELYAGSRSIGKVAENRGHDVFSIDIKPFEGIDLVKDCEFVTVKDLPFIPDALFSGTPCTTYSLSAISHHRNEDRTPKTDFAAKCDRMNINNLRLIGELLEINPNLKWYIENPRAVLRKMEFMKGLPRVTVWNCTYGDTSAKPTDWWSNNLYSLFNPNGWQSRPQCYNGNSKCHHEAAPRGSKTGTQGKKGNYERSIYPIELCKEIIIATEKVQNEFCSYSAKNQHIRSR